MLLVVSIIVLISYGIRVVLTKQREGGLRPEWKMQFCRQYPANSDSSEGMSSALEFETSLVVTYLVPLE